MAKPDDDVAGFVERYCGREILDELQAETWRLYEDITARTHATDVAAKVLRIKLGRQQQRHRERS